MDSETFEDLVSRDELRKRFHLYMPGLATIDTLLDKRKLYAAGERVGLSAPRTWLPTSHHELEQVADEARYPVLIKCP